MSTGIAHEINNPLAIINESAGFMKQVIESPDMDDAEKKQALLLGIEKIEKSVKRASKITFQLLGHVKQQSSQISECNLKALLDETVGMIEKDLKDKRIRVISSIDPQQAMVWSDPYKIRQIFINLLNNAVHAVSSGGSIYLSAGTDTGHVFVSIRDNGIGIPEKNLGKIFDPFFTTKSFEEGTGLGLFVVHKLVTGLGGEILVESRVGKGSCFTVKLPVHGPGNNTTQSEQ
jgi:signal transduction histidine kinase